MNSEEGGNKRMKKEAKNPEIVGLRM